MRKNRNPISKEKLRRKDASKPPQSKARRNKILEQPGNKPFFAPHTSSSSQPPPS
jgi:hypothetical protein